MNINSNDRTVLKKSKLQEITQQIDPRHSLDPEVEEILLEIADDFIESVTTFACSLAKHRGSDTLEVKDLQLHLEKNWNVKIPGFTQSSLQNGASSEEVRAFKRPTQTEAHKQRLVWVKKAQDQLQKQKQKQEKK
ncbi:hypothetical protein FDP41_008662 [Naegleria fowleri]|uniref:Transcription initiation factor TFIID subunit 12 domain-containing protein n=1 Tax=Naegleria fowleri TaxID=5763 RepID=A0A6A5BG92_NAEFO|nr:uncharacterized protein FDP41_008662 [Naegleria fowleri]KAF0972998.1 hypothetical protein FDP41_008662 [Naegleria fowleri]CAG4719276.1 unnamed protein product [Naegleria fowleri]